MGRQPSSAISSNVRWAWRLSRRLIWLQSFWNSDIYSFPKVSAVWRHFLIFLHACVPISRLAFYSPSLPFSCWLPVTLSLPSPFPFHPVLLHLVIFHVSLSLSQFPIFKLGSFQNPAFRRCTTLQSVISVTDSFIIDCTSKTLECSTWPEFEQNCIGYLVSFRPTTACETLCQWGYTLLYSWTAEQKFHMNKPLHVLLSLYTGDLMFNEKYVYRECLYLWGLLISTSKQLFILIYRGRLRLVVTFYATQYF